MNLLNNRKSWMLATVVAASSLAAQDRPANQKAPQPKPIEQGYPVDANQMMAGYNAPARIDVRGSWDIYANASFIYWYVNQDNTELVYSASPSGATTAGSIVNNDYSFKPGFEVGLGMNFDHDNWDGSLNYTWLHSSVATSAVEPTTADPALFSLHESPDIVGDDEFDTASQNWRYKFDFLDGELARSYYVGKRLSFRPFFGARAAWIRQRYSQSLLLASGAGATSSQRSTSWALGPRFGMNANWMFGYGIRAIANTSADLLFTRYNLRGNQESFLADRTIVSSADTSQSKVNTIRPHAAIDLGFGWGTYFDNNNWHFDLAATYGFQAFWDQNMFRQFTDDVADATSFDPNGNLYVQGLNVSIRFDF